MPSWLLDKFKKMAEKKAQREMRDGGKVYYVTGGKMGDPPMTEEDKAALEKIFRESRERNRSSRDMRMDGFRLDGPLDGSVIGVTLGSETTNRVGGLPPEEATMFLRKGEPAEPVLETREKEKEEEEKDEDEIPKETPDPKPDPEVDYTMPGGIQSRPNFKRGIAQSGARGQGTTGDLAGAQFDLVDDKGMLLERGQTKMEDLPDYITQDPTFKKLVEEANSTKYRQDTGRAEGRFSNPGGQAAKDLADIMNGVITLEEYKRRKNIESASMGYGGKVPSFGVKKKPRT